MYDHAGNEVTPADVLDADELADYYRDRNERWRARAAGDARRAVMRRPPDPWAGQTEVEWEASWGDEREGR